MFIFLTFQALHNYLYCPLQGVQNYTPISMMLQFSKYFCNSISNRNHNSNSIPFGITYSIGLLHKKYWKEIYINHAYL